MRYFIMFMLVSAVCFGVNIERIDELKAENTQLNNKRVELMRVVEQATIKILQNNAVIEELVKQDKDDGKS